MLLHLAPGLRCRHTSFGDDLGGRSHTQQAVSHELGAEQGLAPPEAASAGLAHIQGAPIAFVSFANGAFNDFLANWVASVRVLGLPFVVGALDERMADTAAERGWPHLLVGSAAATAGGDDAFFRANFTAFRGMGAKKVQLVLTMLERYGVQTVVVSDSGEARRPWGLLRTGRSQAAAQQARQGAALGAPGRQRRTRMLTCLHGLALQAAPAAP